MILNFLNMDGHGIFVWSAFIFTMVNFVTLYFIISKNLKKEKKDWLILSCQLFHCHKLQ